MRMRKWVILLWSGLVMALMLASCSVPSLDLVQQATPTPLVLSQWAVSATASSSYAFPDWGPNRASGAPEINACVDDPRAWASARGNGVEWLQLSYARPVNAAEVRIHQTYGRGAISRVTLLDKEGNAQVVWEGIDASDPCPGVLLLRTDPSTMKASEVRIDLDESRTGMWNQIDSVELVGAP
jgi:hypothetical protein